MNRIVSIIYFLTCSIIGHSQSVSIAGRIIDKNQTPISDACIMVYSQDSILVASDFSDSLGKFRVQVDSVRSNMIKISCLGFKTIWSSFPICGDIELTTDNQLLSEVVVKGKHNFTKQSSTGFIYNLSNIDFVKEQNLLQALRIVPFVDIDSEGRISVNGNKKYTIYLNGKIFDMAMTNPVQILQSLQAKDVKRIEIITEPDFRFSNNIPIINIITAPNSLDGIYLNGTVKYQSNPNAKVATSFLAKKKYIDISLSYDYDYQSQNNQPIYQAVTTNDNSIALKGNGNGYWHTHILRALTSWRMDSLNVIYADIHAKINKDNYITEWNEQNENIIRTEDGIIKRNQSSTTKGTLEANIIYRNYFRKNNRQEHFMLGYRYAYNPDKRNYTITDLSDPSNFLKQKTNGGINEHTINLHTIVPILHQHQLLFGARTIYRKADINSTNNSGLSYSQNITYPYLNYTGQFKWFNAALNLSCEYEYLSMNNLYGSEANSKSKNFYFLPSLSIYRTFNNWRMNIIYERNLQRPSIVMLNPFYNNENDYFHQVGNPDLKAEIKNVMTIGSSFFKKRFSLSFGVSYSLTSNAILYYQKELSNSSTIISSYDNIGKVNTLTGNLFVNWQPISQLVLKFNLNGGLYNLKSERLNLSQKDYILNMFGWIDYYLPNNWSIGANVMHFKQAPEPFGTINSITNYSAHVGKTWMKGALSTIIEIANPFSKYSKLKNTVYSNRFTTEKINYITTRYIGINISYTLQYGEKSKLKRDSSLTNSDLNSGIQ